MSDTRHLSVNFKLLGIFRDFLFNTRTYLASHAVVFRGLGEKVIQVPYKRLRGRLVLNQMKVNEQQPPKIAGTLYIRAQLFKALILD